MASGMEERLNWSITMQKEHALRYYRNYWNGVERIEEVDAKAKESDAMRRLDFSGIDKIIYTGVQSVHVAQRFRQMRNTDNYGLIEPDFSIRIESYTDKPTEYQKLKEAYNGIGSTPQVYGFGITPHGRQVATSDGFKKFYLIDVDEFLENHFGEGVLKMEGKHPNGDGSMGAYFSIADMEQQDCILEKWPKDNERPDNPGKITSYTDD